MKKEKNYAIIGNLKLQRDKTRRKGTSDWKPRIVLSNVSWNFLHFFRTYMWRRWWQTWWSTPRSCTRTPGAGSPARSRSWAGAGWARWSPWGRRTGARTRRRWPATAGRESPGPNWKLGEEKMERSENKKKTNLGRKLKLRERIAQ